MLAALHLSFKKFQVRNLPIQGPKPRDKEHQKLLDLVYGLDGYRYRARYGISPRVFAGLEYKTKAEVRQLWLSFSNFDPYPTVLTEEQRASKIREEMYLAWLDAPLKIHSRYHNPSSR